MAKCEFCNGKNSVLQFYIFKNPYINICHFDATGNNSMLKSATNFSLHVHLILEFTITTIMNLDLYLSLNFVTLS